MTLELALSIIGAVFICALMRFALKKSWVVSALAGVMVLLAVNIGWIKPALESVGTALGTNVDESILGASERDLLAACINGEQNVEKALTNGDFDAACKALADLREPIDRFFADVLVMDEDTVVRENRLRLLNRFAGVFSGVANIGALSRKK